MTAPMSPKKAPDHFRSSHALEVGAGSALISFRSSTSKAGMGAVYYRIPGAARKRLHADVLLAALPAAWAAPADVVPLARVPLPGTLYQVGKKT